MNTDEYKIAKKDAKSKAYILLFALIAGSIAFISYLSLLESIFIFLHFFLNFDTVIFKII
mgnify:CR=1 FL=1